MHFYSPSPLSLGYIPRRSYRPAHVPAYYLDDECSSALPFEGHGHPAFSHAFSPRPDAETRYRRALHELQAAEEEFEAHLSLKRAREAAVLREQAMRRESALAVQAEVEHIERSRALHPKLAEKYEWRQRAHQGDFGPDRARRQDHAAVHGFVDTDARDPFAYERYLARRRSTHSRPSRHHDSEAPAVEGLLKLLSGFHAHAQPQGPLQQSDSPASSHHRSAEPQPSEKQNAEGDALNAILGFIHGLAAHAGDATNGSETILEVRLLLSSVDFKN
jgi:hypothetical protein